MAIQDADRDIIIAWSGPIDDEDKVDRQITTYGSPYVAALQRLMERRAAFTATPTELAASGDRVSRTNNLKALQGQIGDLVEAIQSDDSIRLSNVAEKLVNSAAGGAPSVTKMISYTANRRRHGG